VIHGPQFSPTPGTDITNLSGHPSVTGERDWLERRFTILVPVPTSWFTVEPSVQQVGWTASDTHPLSFDDVLGAGGNLLGERVRGYANIPAHPRRGRIAICRTGPPELRRAARLERHVRKERKRFGQPIGRYQVHCIHDRGGWRPQRPHRSHNRLLDSAALRLAVKSRFKIRLGCDRKMVGQRRQAMTRA